MKGKGKRLAALLTLIVLTFSSVLVVSAESSNTKLIQRSTSVSNQEFDHTEVSVAENTPDRTGFTLNVKRADDSFTLYNLVNIVASTPDEASGITSIDVQWITPVAEFIRTHEQFSGDADYASPIALGSYTIDQSLSGEAKENAEKAAKAAKEKKLIALINAMKSDYEIVVDKNATALGQMTAVAHVDGSAVESTIASNPSANLNDTPGSEVVIGLSGAAYEISKLKFGLYFVDASNPARASGGGYQPVVVELIPEQTGPSGHWYIDNHKTATLKNESINIGKKINGSDSDIIREGEIVTFNVDIDIPLYTKTGNTFDFTKFCAFDDMSQGFTLIATSATLTYFDAQGREYHPVAALVGDNYGNKTARDTNGTYEAKLIGYSYPVYYSGEENQKAYFYVTEDSPTAITVWVNNGGKLNSIPFTKSRSNGKYTFNTNDLIAINNQLGSDNQIPSAYITSSNAPKFTLSDTTKSLIAVEFNYETLMNEETYVHMVDSASYIQDEEFTYPNKVTVKYDALVNDSAYLGNNDNTNTVTAYYIEDTSGTTGEVSDEVVAWTYGANIVKVDGEAYSDFEKLSDEQKAAQIAEGKAPYLEGAVFDIYRLDTTYCGGAANADKNTAPVERAYNTFAFYDDSTYPVTSVDSANVTTRYTESFRQYAEVLQKAMKYEMTQKMALTDATVIGGAIQSAIGQMTAYTTADQFTNKYNFANAYENVETIKRLHDEFSGNILLDYMIPKAQTLDNGKKWDVAEDFESGFVVFVPRWVEANECAIHSGAHWHLDAYSLFWADTTSVADGDGVLLTGFDPNQYLMIEKTAPAGGYNKLSTAIYFEVNQISDELYTERGNSYASFLSDEYENAVGEKIVDDNLDGIYHFIIKNYSGLTLPSTGGMGTLLFTLIGLIIMGGAIVFVIARRKKLARNAASFMAIALMILSLLVPSMNANAATTISLGNSEGISTGAQKATPNGTAEFIIHLRDAHDTLSVYRIASVSYDDTTMTWSDLEWVPNLYSYLGNYSLDTGNDNIPTTPQQFTELNAKEQADFLTWVYDTKDKSGIGATYKVNDQYISKFDNKTTNENYAKITNVAYGMYLIKGENKEIGRSYSVLTLSAVPEIQGPMGVYYLTGDLEATLKYADVTVDKRINQMNSDVVRTGETVSFEIAGEIPSYYPINGGVVYTKEDGDLYTGYDWNANYKFNITDDMSSAFTLDPSTIEIYLGNSLTEDGWVAPPANSYISLIASPYSAEAGEGVVWFKDSTDKNGYYIIKHIKKNGSVYNLTWYIYNEKEGSIEVLTTGTASSEANATGLPDASITSAYKTATDIQSVGTIARATNKNIFAISFDYSKLVHINDEGKWEQIYKYIGLTYKATVTEDCEPGSQDNTNTVHLWYRSDIAGHYSSVDDTVRAYTYGMRIVKTDGESNPTKYLIGAQFNLYKEAFVYVPDLTLAGGDESIVTAEPSSSNWQYYKFGRYAENGEYSSMTAEIPTDDSETPVVLDTLDKLEAQGTTFAGGLNTYFRYVPVPAGTDGIDAEHYNVIVYKQMALADQFGTNAAGQEYQTVKENTIYSIDTEEGVLIDGLEDASYVLIETVSPTGYNALTEAMRFEISKITNEMRELTENSAYDTDVIFYSANEVNPAEEGIVDAVALEVTENEGTENETTVVKYYQGYSDGIYGINVKNYQGLTLPSTGGIGTLLFTIIGIIIMAAVIIVILAKRKKNSYM
ncbi:LPXTG cell wall anchor domain-containing protein [Pseudobutyrivibrio xylanivorans]|uniref:LPXTG-motif cell wall anchor domain-containing protein n=1 Tax=Pseudobutyrivibrio xylanivorans DSM 14809 TaxID=1123012 RepID=A0A1M6BAS4_PSEXY|nr:LPXTG cell wall anchor domain-containing protein [Pseudobutyrivibrio xylanivorans]SHI45767.1 LPXTG-motif cell wall anchor domain-containing protein [Pseudobutyrivibrio xylanivorans DSM 14809]